VGKALTELGDRLVLTAPEVRPELRTTVFSADQAVRDAMEAALAGDFKALDRLEITYLNVLVRIGELKGRNADGTLMWWHDPRHKHHWTLAQHGTAPFIVAYHRRWGAACAPALEWTVMAACRRCIGRLRRLACSVCGGDWYVGQDSLEHVFTDAHGVVLPPEEQPE